jgi:glycosyltransferase involved in cell wall biosynthesis
LPFALTVHDLAFERYPEFFSAKQRLWHAAVNPRRLCRRADVILAVSENTKKDLVELYGLPPEKIAVTLHGATPAAISRQSSEEFRQRHRLPERFILHVGALEPRKNHLALIDAFALLKGQTRFRDLGLVLAGPAGWRNNEILRAISTCLAAGDIKRLGFVAPADKPALYGAAAAFAFPSFYEGFGLPPLEAMAAGVPVVASFAGSLGEVVADAGVLVDPYRPAELADAIAGILDSPTLAAELSKRGRERAALFTWEECAQKTLDAFRRAADIQAAT